MPTISGLSPVQSLYGRGSTVASSWALRCASCCEAMSSCCLACRILPASYAASALAMVSWMGSAKAGAASKDERNGGQRQVYASEGLHRFRGRSYSRASGGITETCHTKPARIIFAASRAKYVRTASAPARLKPSERFHDGAFTIQPAALDGRHDHRIFARHLIDERRHAECVLHPAHDVEIGHARLDHHHVGAFGDVERNLAQRLVAELAGSI